MTDSWRNRIVGSGEEAPDQLLARFWSKVDRSGECWPWAGSRHQRGYGRMRVGSRRDGSRRLVSASHVAWEIAHGPIPDGMHVLHACDNPPCVNPAHLWVGTHLDNMHDMIAKGRARHPSMPGELSRRNRLSQSTVDAIRSRVGGGEMQKRIADELGVSRALVCRIVGGKAWAR